MRRAPTRRELVFRLASATHLTADAIARTLDGEHVGEHALQRIVIAAERIGVDLPPPPTEASAAARYTLLQAIATHRAELRGDPRHAKPRRRSTEADDRRHARRVATLDARHAPPRGAA